MYSALFNTSEVLRRYLMAQLQAIPALGFGGARVVSLNSPQELPRRTERRRTLRVAVSDRARRHAAQRSPAPRPAGRTRAPTPLRLHYLMTPVTFQNGIGGAPDAEQRIMGRVLQALHSRPVLRGARSRAHGVRAAPTPSSHSRGSRALPHRRAHARLGRASRGSDQLSRLLRRSASSTSGADARSGSAFTHR